MKYLAFRLGACCFSCGATFSKDIAPMSLLDYSSARPWAKSIRAAGDAREMPAPPVFAEGWQMGKPDIVIDIGEDFKITSGQDA